MKSIRIKVPEITDVTFTIECLPEDTPVMDNAIDTGDKEADKQCEDEILHRLESNEWAWCMVKITATWKTLSESDYLGGCSYDSQKDFIDNSGYYEDMRQAAYKGLISQIKGLRN